VDQQFYDRAMPADVTSSPADHPGETMRLYYHQDPYGNFGDDLNPWLWPQLIPDIFNNDGETLFIGIGTLLNEMVPAAMPKVVFGTGAGYGDVPLIDEKWKFFCVRGPLSAQTLGLDSELAITDPAILIKTLDLPEISQCYDLSLMPHHMSARVTNFKLLCEDLGIHLIDPSAEVSETIRDIQRSKILITEAMHGAIVADALRVPWVPLLLHSHILEFKWRDWYRSLGLNDSLFPKKNVGSISLDMAAEQRLALLLALLKNAVTNFEPILSPDSALERALVRLQEKLEQMKAEYFANNSPYPTSLHYHRGVLGQQGFKIHLCQTILTSQRKVFDAWTEPKKLKKWFGSDRYATKTAKVDLRVGGQYHLTVMKLPEGEEFNLIGTYLEISYPLRLVYTWLWKTRVVVEFRSLGDYTEVILTHEFFHSEKTRNRHAEVWNDSLERLAKMLSTPDPDQTDKHDH
jgi:succinoglycan biosynthesis protein ExoV